MAVHENLEVDEIQYDPQNPGIASLIEHYDHDLVGEALQPKDAKFIELKQAIRSNNGTFTESSRIVRRISVKGPMEYPPEPKSNSL